MIKLLRLSAVCTLVAIAIVPTAASAADQIFMLVPGIPGSSTDAAHKNWIDVLAFSGGASAPATSTSPAPPKQPPPQPCQVAIEKFLDIAGPRLWAAAVTGQTFNNIEIQVTAVSGGIQQTIYDIQLTNAKITSINTSGSSGGGIPTESVSFTATNVTLTFTPQNAQGGAGTPVTTSFACD